MNLERNLTKGQEFPFREKKELKNMFAKNQHFLGDRLRETTGSIVEILKWETARAKI